MAQISGTFAGTGVSAGMAAPTITIQMDFAGTASVDVQSQMPSGAWITVETVTADYHKVFDQGGGVPIRLSCTAHTNNVEYSLTSK